MSRPTTNCVRSIAACTIPLAAAFGQCLNPVVSTGGAAGVAMAGPSAGSDETIQAATMWDPDGPGPATAKLVVIGNFEVAGTVHSPEIAAFDPVTGQWSAIGPTDFGMGGDLFSVLGLANGDLVVGGFFQTVNGQPIRNIARWNGTSWSALGAGLNHAANALQQLPNGDLVAGGFFTASGSTAVNKIARWNGSSWSPLGSGFNGPSSPASIQVLAMAVLPNGDLVAAGSFDTAGGVAATNIARWNGSAWAPLGAGLPTPYQRVACLALAPNGDLLAGGTFATGSGAAGNRIARWNGAVWSPLGTGLDQRADCLHAAANGDVFVGGTFALAGGQPASCVARWNGATWAALGTGVSSPNFDQSVRALVPLPNGDLVAAGRFQIAGGVPTLHIARWDGASWAALTTGTDDQVTASATAANGDLVVGGRFTSIGGTIASCIAQRSGAAWVPLGPGLSGPPRAIVRLPNGDLVAAGGFGLAGGLSVGGVARWDGTVWSPLGTGVGPGGIVYALAALPNGDLVLGGDFTTIGGVAAANLAVWNGAVWAPVGNGTAGAVTALAVLRNGDLVVGGSFATAGGVAANRLARWNGSTWSSFGTGVAAFYIPQVSALLPMPDGGLVVGGRFQSIDGVPANCVARWNGTTWSAFGGGVSPAPGSATVDVLALTLLPDGDVVAGGFFAVAGGLSANNLARWNGSAWSAFGTGCDSSVHALTSLPNGDLAIGGSFLRVDSTVSAFVARITTTCPATAATVGSGCTGSAGPNTLTASTLPWLGSTCRAEFLGAPANALVIGAFGLGQVTQSLAALLPQGVAGCSLLVATDVLVTVVPTGGVATLELPIPSTATLVGTVVHEQALAAEFGGNGLLALTSSNALMLTLGSF